MEEEIRFEAQIKSTRLGGAGVEIPFNVKEVFGSAGQIKVFATFDGFPYRGSIAPMGEGKYFIGILKDIRTKIEKQPGDFVCVTLKKDEVPREVSIPKDLLTALNDNPLAKAVFEKMSYTNRKESVRTILEAKKPETRSNRVRKIIEMLLEKKK